MRRELISPSSMEILHAFEIKSDSDSLDRLPAQIEAYQGVFEYITLVCRRRLRIALNVDPEVVGLTKSRKQGRHRSFALNKGGAAKSSSGRACIGGMLWKTEALVCLRKHGLRKVVTSKQSADDVLRAVA